MVLSRVVNYEDADIPTHLTADKINIDTKRRICEIIAQDFAAKNKIDYDKKIDFASVNTTMNVKPNAQNKINYNNYFSNNPQRQKTAKSKRFSRK